MFRFSIRELMLVTLVAAMGVGWWLHYRSMSLAMADAKKWRTSAGALEYILSDSGWDIRWNPETDTVFALKNDGQSFGISTTHFEPGFSSK